MKKIIFFCVSLFFTNIYTQVLPNSEISTLDDKLINIDQTSITSGILYQRSSIFTRLYDYNKVADYNTANVSFFEQSLNDMYYGSNQTKFIDYKNLRDKIIANKYHDNIVDVGIINTPFHMLYYDEENPNSSGLSYNNSTNLFVKNNNGKPSFIEFFATVISPLKKEVKGTSVTFNFNNELLFTNGSKTIQTLTGDLGDGVVRSIISNGLFLSPQSFVVNFQSSGNKKLTFNISYSDNTTLTTYGVFYFQYINNLAPNVRADTKKTLNTICNADNLTEDFSIISGYPFQGYDEPFAFRGKFDYRIFYHTNNGNTDKILLKPIIIIDGFDPGDKRKIFGCEMSNYIPGESFSIQDMMTYYKTTNGQNTRQDLIQQLRDKGYDVVIVNHPTYCISNIYPYNVVACGTINSKEVNGGADYIERNGLTLVTLIKNLNEQLAKNGSIEKLAIVGPSMGGQTSRYALAYFEKNGENHNTRLWISVDSPHLGANIPLGDQALINLLATTGKNVEAADFYNNQLGSAAAKQQLIEFHRDNPNHHQINEGNLDGRIIAQGFSYNSGNSFFQQFYNNQFANGLPNSKGYPLNLRKIALTNGSLSGNTIGVDSEKVLNIRGFQRVNINLGLFGSITFTVHIASLESQFMPVYNTGTRQISRFKKAFDDRTTIAPNINSRGNMDTVPGGWYAAQNDLAKSVLSVQPIATGGSFWHNPIGSISDFFGSSYFELRDFRFNHSFIPTFSSLGIKNPDRNWGENLQRNLVCTLETPFDSYYGTAENTQHTSFTEESVNWLIKELDDQPQKPWFPISPDNLQGPKLLCMNTDTTYSFSNICQIPGTVNWSVSNGLQIISFTDTSVIVRGNSGMQYGIITATFENGVRVEKRVWIGSPKMRFWAYGDTGYLYKPPVNNGNKFQNGESVALTMQVDESMGYIPGFAVNSWQWEKVNGDFIIQHIEVPSIWLKINNPGTKVFRGRALTSCGWGDWTTFIMPTYGPNGQVSRISNVNENIFKTYPNPANDVIYLDLVNQDNKIIKNTKIKAQLYNNLGIKTNETLIVNNKSVISVKGLLQGVYTLRILYDDKIENHQIIVK